MKSIVITEKPSQARNVMKAVGSRYGEVLAAQGHLLRLQSPEEANPDWKAWSSDLLRPQGGRYGLVTDRTSGKGERLDKIKRALSSADQVIIATDCDREGQAIGENLLHFYGYNGRVLRAMFTAEDEKTLREAFASAKPNASYRSLYDAAVARAQADQVFNLSLTRTATTRLVPSGVRAVIGIGRVRTPTLGIVCRREQELSQFKPQDYFELTADIQGEHGLFQLHHRPADSERYFQKATAEAIAAAATGWHGPASVRQENRRQAPGKPVDLPSLQKQAAKWGWTAKKTLDVAQALYEIHKLTTYPRAAVRYLPENMVDGASAVFAALVGGGYVKDLDWQAPTIRTGKRGVFSDAGLAGESHHAIIPNPAVIDQFSKIIAGLNADERKLFDFIAKTFLAALGPDYEYHQTQIAISVPVNGQTIVFKTVGRSTIHSGWRAVYGEFIEDRSSSDSEAELPQVRDGEGVGISAVNIDAKKTKAPARYTEGSLIEAMQNAWRFVEDEGQRAQLKEAKGIGTPATRDTIIEGLKKQSFLTVSKGKLFASDTAMQLYHLLQDRCPSLLDPATTATMEARLDDIVSGRAGADEIIQEICSSAKTAIDVLDGQGAKLDIQRNPSPAMVKAAKGKAEREGKRFTRADLASYDTLRAYLGPMKERAGEPSAPSPAQLKWAMMIAERLGQPLPDEAKSSARALSSWIDANNFASESQMKWICKFVEEGKIKKPKGYPDKVKTKNAKVLLDKIFNKR
ncbi:DNA topoisomerase [Pseudovibrio sp. Alg231-02]|uniref:DNA topoisomerase n=1 Tax=Pseudovibrio sp. Alg231-02 TaxID=1922223 RepID=UPI000D55EC87|nr:DNA topoisomerase [Pseudovibrio sp. Alg231-02]